MKYDKHLYELPLKSLFWYFKGERFPKEGIERFDHDGKTFKRDDIVVVGERIGNIEAVNEDEGVCMLGLSYEYGKCMHNPYKWEMCSGFRCKVDGIRHATKEEKAKYAISADLTCDAAERADAAYKDRRAGFSPRF